MKTQHLPWKEFSRYLDVPEQGLNFLKEAKELASEKGFFLYLAGGPVRDALLKRASRDLDLVLEGNWEVLLPELLAKTKGELLFKSQFLTYKLRLPQGFTIDLVTARRETYTGVASLPIVEPADHKADILRRDFTINALIYGLTPPFEEEVVDLVSGLKDLSEGKICPLHRDSFIEDPTRAFRGVRYKVRLSFNYAGDFYLALERAKEVEAFEKLSPPRLAQELKLFFSKEPLENLFKLIEDSDALNLFELSLLKKRALKSSDIDILGLAIKELKPKDREKFFLLFLIELEEKSLARLGFLPPEREKILKVYKIFTKEYLENLDILERVEAFEKLPSYVLLRLALEENLRHTIMEFWNTLRHIKPHLSGHDLKALGVEEGKKVGLILREIRRRKLKGEIKTLKEEKELVKALLFRDF
jgi:tRNA nucleotidyltransferase (CCA-adding enzyme)